MIQTKGCGLGALALLVSALAFWGTFIYFGGWIAAGLVAFVSVLVLWGVCVRAPTYDDDYDPPNDFRNQGQ